MAEEVKFKKGERYVAIHKVTKEKVEIVGVNQESGVVLLNTVPGTLDNLSNYGSIQAKGKLTKKDAEERNAAYGSNWDN